MNIAQINVNGVIATAKDLIPIPAGLIGATVTFKFEDEVWKSLTKTVCFRGAVSKDVVDVENMVAIPCEVLAESGRRIAVGVYGTDADKQVAIPTLWAELGFTEDAADPSGDRSTDPALPVWAQMQEEVSKAMDTVKALEEAKGRGEFKGDPGPAGPQGPQGVQGEPGAPGHTPARGVDYWTEEDKAEIVEETEKTAIGDIDAAVEEILKIQEALIDGAAVPTGGSIFTESTEHPGCYYIEQDGVQRWLNPPMEYGVEYATLETYKGHILYKMTIDPIDCDDIEHDTLMEFVLPVSFSNPDYPRGEIVNIQSYNNEFGYCFFTIPTTAFNFYGSGDIQKVTLYGAFDDFSDNKGLKLTLFAREIPGGEIYATVSYIKD